MTLPLLDGGRHRPVGRWRDPSNRAPRSRPERGRTRPRRARGETLLIELFSGAKEQHDRQEFARGVALSPPADAGPATASGTTLVFRPDAEIFDTVEYGFAALAAWLTELAFLNPGLDLVLTDERSSDGPQRARLRFLGGVREFVALLDAQAGEDPRMAGSMEVALAWSGTHEGDHLGAWLEEHPREAEAVVARILRAPVRD
ncbi:hypothetical protein NRK68_02945 [Streptomyces yangpuensis]|uniref:DNA topoisomerase (ATP-hydrolyzing) n=1 Tax=Streptomyces yangpuensis TaxID=1648182 RepID=A0ABY5PQ47_9ACTN|nr:hypothetical protein [Streptomyces yangpuensis]UUY46267.1 hypothetical protein NRK68_02945 [Streptomyces yangpuensis]